jgi:hypothetical protein
MGTEYEQEQGGQAPGFRSTRILKDRDRENAYMVVAEFDSYELAMGELLTARDGRVRSEDGRAGRRPPHVWQLRGDRRAEPSPWGPAAMTTHVERGSTGRGV